MRKPACGAWMLILSIVSMLACAGAQDRRVERIRVGGGSTSATQMSMWLAKEGGFYEKHGLSVEAISIPGSSLALQAMLAGELPIIQLGGAASIQANLAGADTIIIASIVKKFLFWIYGRADIGRMEDLKGKVFGTTRFGTLSDLASRFALRLSGIDPERDITMVQTGGPEMMIRHWGPDTNIPVHSHPFHEMFYDLEGEIEIGGTAYGAGACIYIEKGTPYGPTRAPKGGKVLRYAEARPNRFF